MPHEPTRACEADHCAFHNEDEPVESSLAIVCGECLHRYPNVPALAEADAAKRVELGIPVSPPELRARVYTADLGNQVFQLIPTCPLCGHDF